MRTAYRCRAYPDDAQQQMLARTFGCVRVVWNHSLAERHARYQAEGKGISYAESDRALTELKKDPDLAFLNDVSSVPLQQALRHQHAAFTAFFARRARYPRFKSRHGRQAATYTRSAFRMKDGALWLAKTCGYLLAALSLGTRHWTCPGCGTRHDRDCNAAKNILAAGLAAGADNGTDACGGGVRRAGAPRARSPVKQEPQSVRAGIPVL
jgi:transposase